MKNLSLILNGVLAIAVAVLFYLHFTGTTAASTKVTVNTDGTSSNESIAYVNSDSLLNNFNFYKELKSTADAKRNKVEKDLVAKKTAFQQEVMNYQQSAPSMTDLQRQTTEQRLGKKQQDLALYEQKQSELIMKEEEKATNELYSKISDYLKVYSKEKSLKVVLAYTKGSGILYANAKLDITGDVIKGLNAEYSK